MIILQTLVVLIKRVILRVLVLRIFCGLKLLPRSLTKASPLVLLKVRSDLNADAFLTVEADIDIEVAKNG